MFTPILIIDDLEAGERLSAALSRSGLCAAVTPQVHQSVLLARQLRPELVILALQLRDADGRRVLVTLRRHGFRMPVVVLADDPADAAVAGVLAAGADHVLARQRSPAEQAAEVVAFWRGGTGRAGRLPPPVAAPVAAPAAAPAAWTHATATLPATPATPVPSTGGWRRGDDGWAEVRFGEVVLRPATRQVWRRGRPVELRPKELDVLIALARRPGRVVARETLLREAWGSSPPVTGRAVDNCVVALRRALEETPALPRHICTVRKFGYRLDLEPLPMTGAHGAHGAHGGRGDTALRPYAAAAAAAARDRCA